MDSTWTPHLPDADVSLVVTFQARALGEVNGLRIELNQAVAPLASVAQVEQALAQAANRQSVDSAIGAIEKKANIEDINRSLTEVKTRAGRYAHLRTTHHATLHATPPRHATLALPSALRLVAATPPLPNPA